jgi:hypothetical protein
MQKPARGTQTMTQNTNIKTLKDGSIDYAHYISRSHEIRSHDAHQMLVAIWRVVNKIALAIKCSFLQRSLTSHLQVTSHPLVGSTHKPFPSRTKADNDNTAEASKESRALG